MKKQFKDATATEWLNGWYANTDVFFLESILASGGHFPGNIGRETVFFLKLN